MRLPLVVAVAMVCSIGAGCASHGYAPLEANVESMKSVREALEEANAQTDRVLASLNKVVAWADRDPLPAFDEFEDDLGNLEDLAEEASVRAQAMKDASEAYFRTWQAENSEMKTEGLHDLSAERMNTARESWRNVQDQATAMSDSFQEFLDRLREIKGYLSSNMSPSGIEAARPYIGRAEMSGRTLKERIADLTAAIDRSTAKVAPAGAAG